MHTGFHYLGFAADLSEHALEKASDEQVRGVGSSHCINTDLRLDSLFVSLPSLKSKGTKRKWSAVGDGARGNGSSLFLGLGCSSSSSDSHGSSGTACTTITSAKEGEEFSMDLDLNFNLNVRNDFTSPKELAHVVPKASNVESNKLNLELSLSTGHSGSVVSSTTFGSNAINDSVIPSNDSRSLLLDDASTATLWKAGTSESELQLVNKSKICFNHSQISAKTNPDTFVPDFLPTIRDEPKSSIDATSGLGITNGKICQFKGCVKGARGASGLCIAHGGGRRCQKDGCHKGAEGRTVYCKAHGGGRRCQHLGCTKSAEGRTDYCIAHGGGRRCSHNGCTRAARGKSGLCIRHGGGKRCQMENCTRSAEGFSGLCISHGGGRRCQFSQCTKGAQGSTLFCKAHGGGKRCTAPGCTKGAEGSTPFCKGHGGGKRCSFEGGGVCPKSVHGGTLYCVAHGGGKRCAAPDCTKSARGRTEYCVRHGGGRRCKFEGCGKSAQGSTDFCKAHGGGKRCSWGQTGSEFGAQSTEPCDRFARGKIGLCAAHSALVQDKRVHGGGHFGPIVQNPKSNKPQKEEVGATIDQELLLHGTTKMGQIGVSFADWAHLNSKKHDGHPVIPTHCMYY
ncbi:hypothetical protein Sjap_021041 [Stephania japonica]|uniref:WRKY19-like zinc finger domain-containing protein n=1 Tax=Stephania japonica TaxID=461633 RepID=A0AAP0F7E6_9MAGN